MLSLHHIITYKIIIKHFNLTFNTAEKQESFYDHIFNWPEEAAPSLVAYLDLVRLKRKSKAGSTRQDVCSIFTLAHGSSQSIPLIQ